MDTGVSVTKLGEHIGARVDGVRLGGDMDPKALEIVHRAWLEHKVVFFRGQHHLDDDAQYAFAERMGVPTSAHPTLRSADVKVLALDSEEGGRANRWHTDVTFCDRPPKASILRAVTLPPYGGSTCWANTATAYEQLPASLRALADGLWAVHTNEFDYAALSVEQQALARSMAGGAAAKFASVRFETEHPVVRTHPETGERALLLGAFAKRILGVSAEESQALLRSFHDRTTRLENTIRWNWAPGDVAMWDNRATQHYAVSDYGDHRRVMRRVTLAGDVPANASGEQSRVVAGDASEYSVIDTPKPLASSAA
ncbi:MAG: TauD/TfdA dioxygenase family protein [Segniliparus sp.]|uniref:TauD/TfdA dioxygenase family protein n=1 Tax=Segniliparus sp. TaxID=2804064 RepID=UPI003F318A2F